MSINIGDIHIKTPVFLAPMSGVSDKPFRKLVKKYGAGLVFSEMIASRAMIDHSKETLKMTDGCAEEYPMAVQLAGCDPEVMAEAARMNVDRGAAIIDINFGCPVKKIVNKFAGSALMKDEDLAVQIVEATVKAVNVPVTVKMRLGWDAQNKNAPSLARKCEEAGAQMITVHGRTRDQLYKGTADWKAIRAVKEQINVPLIVNGDIETPKDAIQAMSESGAQGVMIGRGCYGKPWIISQVMEYLETGNIPAEPDLSEKRETVLEHYRAILEHYGDHQGVVIARKHLAWYCKGERDSASFRAELNKQSDPNIVISMLKDFFSPELKAVA